MKYPNGLFFAAAMACFVFSCKQHTENILPSELRRNGDSIPAVNPYVSTDQSPMDMAWCPAGYPVEKMKGNDSLHLIARVIYSRPHKKGRQIFGEGPKSLCPYGKPWRLGANEATELDLLENVSIAGKNISKGMYIMYCIPQADHWTIVLNGDLYTWGLHINTSKDIFRTDLPVMQQSPALEDFTIAFTETPTGGELTMAWDQVKTVLPLTYVK